MKLNKNALAKIKLFIIQFTVIFTCNCFAQKPASTPAKSMLKTGHYYRMKYDGPVEIWSFVDAMMTDSSNIIYKGMEIFFDGKSIYKDTLHDHIALGNPDYEVKKVNNTTYEIFAGENHRPEDIRTTYFKIKNGAVVKKGSLPGFINAKGSDLDHDGKKEYAGVLYDSTTLPDPEGSVWYWPLLCYEETGDGLVLDSVLTIKETKLVYGTFHGFKNNRKIILPVYEKLQQEIDRIKSIQ